MRCLIARCREGQCPACVAARCAWCQADTRFTQSHTINGNTFCGPSNNSPCAWHYHERHPRAA
jgi:hypothetical protein